MKKIITSIFTFALLNAAFAQQDPQFSMAMQNRLAINPGYAGSTGLLCGNLLARQQWTGFEGRPRSIAFCVDLPVMKETDHPGGVGLTVIADQAGLQKTSYVKGAYAYRLMMGNGGSLGIGLELGMLNVGYGTGFIAETGTDARIPFNGASKSTFDLGFGLNYSIPNKLHFGVSVSHLTASTIKDVNLSYSVARHIYVTGGYDYALPNNPNLVIKPSILFKTSLNASQLDVNVVALMNNAFWGGLSYRLFGSDAIVPMIGYQSTIMENRGTFKAGYSYDVTLSKLRGYSSGSHEILLGFCYDITPPVKVTKHKNPRFI
jgi:type IX secretion system PorP/SprF family membrane protein